jgi:hypothetical protein
MRDSFPSGCMEKTGTKSEKARFVPQATKRYIQLNQGDAKRIPQNLAKLVTVGIE